MKMPQTPPASAELLDGLPAEVIQAAFAAGNAELRDRRYDPWEKVRRRTPPEGLSVRAWWWGIKQARRVNRRAIPLLDRDGEAFTFTPTDAMAEAQHRVDLNLGGRVPLPEEVSNPETRGRYVVSSLVEEAVRSSQMEGAAVSRDRARQMIRTDRKPRDRGERMILNNFLTMEWLKERHRDPMTPEAAPRHPAADDRGHAGRSRRRGAVPRAGPGDRAGGRARARVARPAEGRRAAQAGAGTLRVRQRRPRGGPPARASCTR